MTVGKLAQDFENVGSELWFSLVSREFSRQPPSRVTNRTIDGVPTSCEVTSVVRTVTLLQSGGGGGARVGVWRTGRQFASLRRIKKHTLVCLSFNIFYIFQKRNNSKLCTESPPNDGVITRSSLCF